jgi:uncharacterized protein YoxC
MVIEIAAGVVALAAVVVVVVLVPMLIHLRHTAEEAEKLLRHMNQDWPILFREATEAAIKLNQVAGELKEAAAGARVLGGAVGEIGDTISHVTGAVRGGAGTLLTNVGSLLAGFRAAFGAITHKSDSHHEGGSSNGG